jgi:hypothetical protein
LKEKSTTVEINGTHYQINRFSPYVGTHILMKIIGTVIKAGSERQVDSSPPPADSPEIKRSGLDIAKAICSAAFVSGLDEKFQEYVHTQCLAKCARIEGDGIPMPISNAQGPLPDIGDDAGLIIRLTMETLAWNFADFFEQGGMQALGGA